MESHSTMAPQAHSLIHALCLIALSAGLGVSAASLTGCSQAYNQLGPFGGLAKRAVDDYFDLELSYSIALAPQDNVEQVFFYLSRTSDIAAYLHQETTELVHQFAVLFEINANAKTAEGLAAIAGAAKKLDRSKMSHSQREWLASNIDEMGGTLYAIFQIAESAGSFVGAVGAAVDDVETNPTIVLKYFNSVGDAVDDARQLADSLPALTNCVDIINTFIDLGKAEGLEPPNEEQSKLLADKAASSAIGEEVTFS